MIGYASESICSLIAVTKCPGLKKPTLIYQQGDKVTKIGSFNSDESVQIFFDALHSVFGVDHVKWEDDIRLDIRLEEKE